MLPESLKDAPRVFAGARFDVHEARLTDARGQVHVREVVVHPGAVVILPLLRDEARGPAKVVLIRNQRFAVGQTLWELPAGTLEPGEPPEACAGRELIEETGYRARKITPLCDFLTSPGFCTEKMYAYLAEGLSHVGQDLDATEKIVVESVPLDRAMKMVQDHEIRDGKSIATLLYYHSFTRKGGR